MGYQEHLGASEPRQGQNPFLGFPVDITGEEEGDLFVAEVQDEREFVVIGVGIGLLSEAVIGRRVECPHFQALDQTGSGKRTRIESSYSSLGQGFQEVDKVAIHGGDAGIPELLDRELGGDEGEATEMVRVGVAEDHGIEAVNPAMPEVWRHHIAAHVERGPGKAAAVNQHGTAFRKLHDRGAPLAHIEKSNP
jgi:hypothetical protein